MANGTDTRVYDPAKRHEYYLKTRQLKGRHPGTIQKVSGRPRTSAQSQTIQQRREHLQNEVNALKGRLLRLQKVLQEEVRKAQIRSGIKPTQTSTQKTSGHKGSKKTSKLTAQQKAKKAAAEKKYRENNPEKFLEDQIKSLNQRIKTILERIAKMRKEGSVGARGNSVKKGDSQNGT